MKELLEILYDIFYTAPEFEDINKDLERWQSQLVQKLDDTECKLVDGMLDAKDCMTLETSIDSFIFGFRLAVQLANELSCCEITNPLPTSQNMGRSTVQPDV